jgi:flavin-dependent dehydrogenase
VRLFEKSPLPRHKVCGEFLSPGVAAALARLGAWDEIQGLAPARIDAVTLHIGEREKRWRLPETAFGLSRYALDAALVDLAVKRGAELLRRVGTAGELPTVAAQGRTGAAPRARRLFGFKAHYGGPAADSMGLYFFSGCYAGVSAIENGMTNVCGVAPEDMLAPRRFKPDELLAECRPLRERMAPLRLTNEWLITGPLIFRRGFNGPVEANIYPAGDALGFIDPFTGSGILGALITGALAGAGAARGLPVLEYLCSCARALNRQYRVAAFFRAWLRTAVPEALTPVLPGNLLYRLTRPRLVV